MYVKTTCGNFFEVAKTEEFESGSDLTVWKIKSTIYDDHFFYYDGLGIAMVYNIEYEMEEKEYVTELARWLLCNSESNGARARDLFLKWGRAHRWSFMINDGKAIFGTNGKEVVMVSRGADVSWDM